MKKIYPTTTELKNHLLKILKDGPCDADQYVRDFFAEIEEQEKYVPGFKEKFAKQLAKELRKQLKKRTGSDF